MEVKLNKSSAKIGLFNIIICVLEINDVLS